MSAAPDYKAMYLALFRANEKAARLLRDAQLDAERTLLQDDPPPLRLNDASPEGSPPPEAPE